MPFISAIAFFSSSCFSISFMVSETLFSIFTLATSKSLVFISSLLLVYFSTILKLIFSLIPSFFISLTNSSASLLVSTVSTTLLFKATS